MLNRYDLRRLVRSPFGRSLSLVMVAFTLIPIVILTALSVYTVQIQLQDRSLTEAAAVGDLSQQLTNQWLGQANNQLVSLLKGPAFAQNSSFILQATATDVSRAELALTKDFESLVNGSYFSALSLVRPDDSVALSSQSSLKGGTFQIGLAQLTQAGQHAWGFGQLPLLGQRVGLIWQPVIDQRQQVIGFLVGQINVGGLSALLQKNAISLGQTGEVYLIDDHQALLTDLRLPPTGGQPKLSFTATIGKNDFSGLFEDYANHPVVGTIKSLQPPFQGWLVIYQQQGETFDTLYRLIRTVGVLSFILVGLAILASVFIGQRIVDPLQHLSRAAHAMAAGSFSTRVDIRRRDELGGLATSFNSMATELQNAFNRLEKSNQKLATRAEQVDAITRVGQHATSLLKLDDLITNLAREIQQTFGYYAVTIFLPDPQTSALVAKTAAGASTDQFMAVETRIDLGSKSLVATAAVLRQTVNVPDILQDTRYMSHPLRPATRSEVSIPLFFGQDLLGVLDIQSERLNRFSQDDLEILQILANQIVIAIRNADLFRESELARQVADDANRQKSEFLSNMSHELRTPLNVIIGYSHSVLNRPAMYDHVPLPPVYIPAMQSVMNSGQHLLGLINDILDLSKIEAGQIDLNLEAVDPLPILQGVRATSLGLIKEGVQLRADYPEKLPKILGDELRIRQILLNLVSNAAKFTNRGFITLNARPENNRLLFIVADTGSGIPENARPHLFDRFRQADRQIVKTHGGSGLGLSISRHLCMIHGGDIWFESQVDQGTTFFFTIPLAPNTDEKTQPKHTEQLVNPSMRAVIFDSTKELAQQALLIDTQSDSRNQLRAVLSQAGYDVLVADDAARGLEFAEAVLPNLLIIHIHASDPATVTGLPDQCSSRDGLSHVPIIVLHDLQVPIEPSVIDRFIKISKTN